MLRNIWGAHTTHTQFHRSENKNNVSVCHREASPWETCQHFVVASFTRCEWDCDQGKTEKRKFKRVSCLDQQQLLEDGAIFKLKRTTGFTKGPPHGQATRMKPQTFPRGIDDVHVC